MDSTDSRNSESLWNSSVLLPSRPGFFFLLTTRLPSSPEEAHWLLRIL